MDNASDPANVPLPRLMLAREAAQVLSVSERNLWSLAKAGKVRSVRIGRLVRFDLPDLMQFIEQSKLGGHV